MTGFSTTQVLYVEPSDSDLWPKVEDEVSLEWIRGTSLAWILRSVPPNVIRNLVENYYMDFLVFGFDVDEILQVAASKERCVADEAGPLNVP